jgi:hypothetical protein
MWCRTVRKALDEYLYGTLSSRREGRVRAHLAQCESCRREEEEVLLVHDALSSWPDVPAPEDGYNRLDSRLSFAPPPAIPLRPRRVRHLVAPYLTGFATAACLMLLVTKPWIEPTAPDPIDVESSGLLPGERSLEPVAPLGPITVDLGDGSVIEIPIDEETWRRLDRRTQEDLLRRMPPTRTVDYEAK